MTLHDPPSRIHVMSQSGVVHQAYLFVTHSWLDCGRSLPPITEATEGPWTSTEDAVTCGRCIQSATGDGVRPLVAFLEWFDGVALDFIPNDVYQQFGRDLRDALR